MPASLASIQRARSLLGATGLATVRLQADGDIGPANVAEVAAAGVDDIVVGRALFSSSDPAALVRSLRAALDLASTGAVAA